MEEESKKLEHSPLAKLIAKVEQDAKSAEAEYALARYGDPVPVTAPPVIMLSPATFTVTPPKPKGSSTAIPPNPQKVTPNMERRTYARIDEVRFRDLVEGDEVKHLSGLLGKVVTHHGSDSHWLIVDQNGNEQDAQPKDSQTLLKSVKWQLILKGVAAVVDFDSVILADDKKRQITDAISQVDNHKLIFEDWGFGEVFEKGTAISLLFYGPPGTGKTLMAQAIADRYKRHLQLVSTAEIETPEPGGAERNLKKYFEEAQHNKSVLLFDECDSLITDRGRVGMILAAQINALLTELERYTGIVVFTTNRLGALDPAFDRRLSLKLEFPMPDAKLRVEIWKRMFPKKAPLASNIRWEDLGSVEIAGGHIKNVVLKAARQAAAAKLTEITDEVLWDCLEKEIESLSAYSDALDKHNPWYGTPVKGGSGGMGVSRDLTMGRHLGRREISRG